jgi:hypothetical protein
MTGLCEAEVQREAKRVLRKLEEGAFLAPDRDSQYALRFASGEARAIRMEAVVVRQFKTRGWLAPSAAAPKNFVISEAGKTWLAQALGQQDRFAAQHRVMTTRKIVDGQGRAQSVAVNENESPLSWLRHRKLITAVQFAAGERFRRDFTLAQLMPRLCADLEALPSGGRRAPNAVELPDTVIAAKQRFSRALDAAGPGLSDLLIDVCCYLAGLADCEQRKDWPRSCARVVLGIGLDRLAAHYGLKGKLKTRAAIRSWHTPEHAVES